MKAVILGVGRMGTAIAYAMDKLGFDVCGMDTQVTSSKNMPENSNSEFFLVDDVDDALRGLASQKKPDIVISSLPYHQTKKAAFWCVDNGVRYCDLGGRVDVSESINTYAKEKASKPVFTDLGLAPGWVNILAEQGCKEIHAPVESVKMMVGGLPAIRTNPPLNYVVTWSVDGLINEYKDDCEILLGGEVETVAGMSGLEKVEFDLLDGEDLEAFYTSGGASHSIPSMKLRGIKDCSYKTIRYKGHRDAVKFLIEGADLGEDCIRRVFENGCSKSTGDVVLVKAEVKSKNLTWKKEAVVGYDDKFSAMQKSTAFSISSVAALMAEGIFDDRKIQNRGGDIKLPLVLAYGDVPFKDFEKNLRVLGIEI